MGITSLALEYKNKYKPFQQILQEESCYFREIFQSYFIPIAKKSLPDGKLF
jgi:hypothetical protein